MGDYPDRGKEQLEVVRMKAGATTLAVGSIQKLLTLWLICTCPMLPEGVSESRSTFKIEL